MILSSSKVLDLGDLGRVPFEQTHEQGEVGVQPSQDLLPRGLWPRDRDALNVGIKRVGIIDKEGVPKYTATNVGQEVCAHAYKEVADRMSRSLIEFPRTRDTHRSLDAPLKSSECSFHASLSTVPFQSPLIWGGGSLAPRSRTEPDLSLSIHVLSRMHGW